MIQKRNKLFKREITRKRNRTKSSRKLGKGGEGATDLAEKVVKLAEKEHKFKYAYELNESIKNKIEDVAKKIYGAESVEFLKKQKKRLKK